MFATLSLPQTQSQFAARQVGRDRDPDGRGAEHRQNEDRPPASDCRSVISRGVSRNIVVVIATAVLLLCVRAAINYVHIYKIYIFEYNFNQDKRLNIVGQRRPSL